MHKKLDYSEKWECEQMDAFNKWMLTASRDINQFSALAGWMACARASLQTAQPVAPKGWRDRLHEMRDAGYTYSQHAELAHVIFDSVIDALDELEKAALSTDAQTVRDQALWDAVEIVRDARDSIGAGGLAENAQYERGIVGPYLDGIEDEIRALQSQPAGKASCVCDSPKFQCTDQPNCKARKGEESAYYAELERGYAQDRK